MSILPWKGRGKRVEMQYPNGAEVYACTFRRIQVAANQNVVEPRYQDPFFGGTSTNFAPQNRTCSYPPKRIFASTSTPVVGMGEMGIGSTAGGKRIGDLLYRGRS